MSTRVFYPLFLLVVPLFGTILTDEVNWSTMDFAIMGILLFLLGLAINVVMSRVANRKNRILYIGLAILVFLLVWAELAVGIC